MLLRCVALSVLAINVAHAAPSSQWTSSEQADVLDGKVTTFIVRGATKTEYTPQRSKTEHSHQARLLIACQQGKTVVTIGIENKLFVDHAARISWRIDDKPPVKDQKWDKAVDSTALGLWGGSRSIAFIKSMKDAKSIYVRITNNVFAQTETTFDVDGLDAALGPVRKACKW